ncbi:hypothetical protein ACTJKK_15530 [Microbacterium sp. 22179]|uniref:hypothetical protein n=1 Tax=Microbacterium sp. 22179 TaxID=3453886 RepID=UPI003F85B167
MDYAAELRRHPPVAGATTDTGLIEFECDLLRGTDDELGIQAYATSSASLESDVLPVLTNALDRLDSLCRMMPEYDADLAIVTLYEGRLGLTFWERTQNNEFIAIFTPDDAAPHGWRYDGLGDLFGG